MAPAVNLWTLGFCPFPPVTPLKTNMDTQNDGLEKVTPIKHCNLWYRLLDFWGEKIFWLYASTMKKVRQRRDPFCQSQ